MKVNLILLSLLAALLTFTYFWEERDGKLSISSHLITNKPQRLVFPKVKLVKKEQGWYLEDYLIPIDTVFSLLIDKMLDGLNIESEIKIDSDKRDQYFSQTNLSFKIDDQVYRLGDYSTIDKGFFILKGSSLFLVKDKNDYQGVFRSAAEEDLKKYINLKNLIDSQDSYLIPPRIILSPSVLKSVSILTGNSRFELDIESNKTMPPPLSGLKEINLLEKINELNKTGKILNVFRQKKSPKTKYVSKLEVNSQSLKNEYYLYDKYNEREGFFIWNSKLGLIVEVESIKDSLLSSNVSDFWFKSFSLIDQLKLKKSVRFKLIKGNKEVPGEVSDTSKFTYSSSEFNLVRGKFNLLFGILLNNPPFEQASFVQKSKQLSFDFTLELEGMRFSFKSTDGLLKVYDHESQVEFVFIRQKASLPRLKFEEFFTLNEKKP